VATCRAISFSIRQQKGESGKETGDEERGSLQDQLVRGDRKWKFFSRWYELFGACARNQVQDRVTESLTPLKNAKQTKAPVTGDLGSTAGSDRDPGVVQASTGTSPVRKRQRTKRSTAGLRKILMDLDAHSSDSEHQSEEVLGVGAAATGAQDQDDEANQNSDSDAVVRGVKDPKKTVSVKEGSSGRRNSQRHRQVWQCCFNCDTVKDSTTHCTSTEVPSTSRLQMILTGCQYDWRCQERSCRSASQGCS
jgi:hypothetical protein